MSPPTFEQSLSQAGTRVMLRHDSGMIGECTGRTRDDGDGLMVQVRFPGQQAQFEMAEDLEPAENEPDEHAQIMTGRFARSAHMRKRLTAVQLAGQLSEMIYSLDTTDTEFMPHQFKPLLALLDSPSKGVLIADEVGLGKTIEAGLIWTELRFRTSATRLLVVCPAVLTEKWKQELFRRFGTNAQVMNATELLHHLKQGDAGPKVTAIICSLQGIRPPTDATEEDSASHSSSAKLARFLDESVDQTLFDLVVIDEAHYLRNRETSSAFLGQLLRPVADYFVLLSATPVNNRSSDLFNLVSLVDPDQFRFESEFENVLGANLPLVRLANQLKRPNATVEMVREALDEAAEHWMFENSASLDLVRSDIEGRTNDEGLSPEERVALSHRLERVNLLGQIVVRSRKRDVLQNRVDRKVENHPVPMTATEQEFYRRVTEAVMNYALTHNGVHGFLLATPQRQMSSCMYAAAKRWVGVNSAMTSEESAEFVYDTFGVDADEAGDSASGFVARAIAGHVDLADLRANDSKYEQLESLLQHYFKIESGEKAIVFSYFRDTLDYLKERLDAVGIPALVVKGGDDKQTRIEEFKQSDRYRVLLASEVAAEGVDLQFMRFLVNYDLPWNPMRIEQRIGRIDRIGQVAEAITIVNLVYKDSIDDRILVKLFEKLRIFEDALGSTEEVIGEGINLLTKDLLSARRTVQQQDALIDQTRIAMENKRRDLAAVEEHEADFVGLGEYVRDRVSHARNTQRRITDEDLRRHILEFLVEHAPGYTMRMEPGGEAGIIRLPPAATADLKRFREARQMTRSKLESGGETEVVIRNHVKHGAFPPKYELINQYHPLVRMIADHDKQARKIDLVVAAEVSATRAGLDIPAGNYAFAAELWNFDGARKEETIKAAFISVVSGVNNIGGELAFDLLNSLRAQAEDWIDVSDQFPDKSVAAELLEQAKGELVKQFREARRNYEAENSDRIRIQRESLARAHKRRVDRLTSSIHRVIESRRAQYTKMTEGKIRKLQEQYDVAAAMLDRRERPTANRIGVVSGFVKVVAG